MEQSDQLPFETEVNSGISGGKAPLIPAVYSPLTLSTPEKLKVAVFATSSIVNDSLQLEPGINKRAAT